MYSYTLPLQAETAQIEYVFEYRIFQVTENNTCWRIILYAPIVVRVYECLDLTVPKEAFVQFILVRR